jgi:hypothetical protein
MSSILCLAVIGALLPLVLAQGQCPAFPSPRPAPSTLPSETTLPDPFKYLNLDRRVGSTEEWYNCRQPEIKRLLQEYQFGFYPDHSAETVTGSRNGNTLTISVSAAGKSGSFTATITLPSGASPTNKAPVMLAIGAVSNAAYTNARIAVVTINYGNVAPDSNAKTGAFWSLYDGRDVGE